ncbi:MAG TPA: acyl carrier protein [Rhodanobacter sp.]|nr:acyl carrier protein [Acetobacteraceae bacterium]HVC16041.1 acyl carrier protein [Rhodanobacter sp.]
MGTDEVIRRLQTVFHEVFDDDAITLQDTTTAADIDGWDSVANIRLMVSIEEAFHLRFDVGEFQDYRNVGDLVTAIARRAG